ncbi:MAG: serine hydrolase [Parasphingorhabdus sp.]
MKVEKRLFLYLWIVAAALPLPFFSNAYAMPGHVVSEPYQVRAGELLEILKGAKTEEQFFARSFLEAVPTAQFRTLTAQLKAQYGQPVAIIQIIPASDKDGTLEISYEKATLAFRMVIDQAEPHPVIGLLVTGAKVRGDDLSKITKEFQSLPGSAGFEIARIDGGNRQVLSAYNGGRQYGIGSTFKLYVLAELNRSIKVGARNWHDVLRIDRKSLPSGVLQNWPDGAPLTLQTLATLMISISDNTATDLLIAELGKDKIADMIRNTGHSDPSRTIPILTTLEFFSLKMPENTDVRKRFSAGGDTQQSSILDQEASRLSRRSVAIENLANKPQHIEEIEWFASPSDISRLMLYLNQEVDPVTKKIISISGEIGPGDKARWAYLGSKGGSEPGVISFAFLAISKSGKSYSVSGSWNNPDEPIDGPKFQTLMNRLLNLSAEIAD